MFGFGTSVFSRWLRVVVSGDSMSPTFHAGDWLVMRRIDSDRVKNIRLGSVVMVEREDRPGIYLIKRLQKSHGDLYWVEGDNPASTDSRQWGWITRTEIVGQFLFRIKRASFPD